MRRQEARETTRKCIVTGALAPPEQLLRFVLDLERIVTPDLAAKAPGRGAWVQSSRDAVVAAASKGAFSRAFGEPARLAGTPEVLAEVVAEGLEARALAALGLARRAGAVVVGFDQVRAALKDGSVGVLLAARDAAEDGAAKLSRSASGALVVQAFTAEAQSKALGRDNVMHAAVRNGPEADRLMRELSRLGGFTDVLGLPIAVEAATA